MIEIRYGKNFLKSAKVLPTRTRKKLASLIPLLEHNPFHLHLHAKQLSGKLTGLISFRITRDWRVIFQFLDPRTIQLLRVAHRKDIYR